MPENKSSNSGYDFREYNIGYDENLDYDLKYHSSWNQLMPVIEKIGSLAYKDSSLYVCPVIDIKEDCYILVLINLGNSKKNVYWKWKYNHRKSL